MNKYFGRIDKLIEVRDCLINNPQRFNYLSWLDGNLYKISGKDMQCNDNWCGSCACVAGHVISLSCPSEVTINDFCDKNILGGVNFSGTALNILETTDFGYEEGVGRFLFEPWDFEDALGNYTKCDHYEDYSKFALAEAVARINWVIENRDLDQYESLNVKDFQ